MSLTLDEFYTEQFQELLIASDVDGAYKEDVFFETVCAQLEELGEISEAIRVPYLRVAGGIRVDGYGGDPAENDGTLTLIVLDFNQSPSVEGMTASDMNSDFKRVTNFLKKSLDEKFRNALEESGPGFGLADLIATRWPAVSKVQLMLVTNRQLRTRVDRREAEMLDDRTITYNVWDIERLYQLAIAERGREDIEIDLAKEDDLAPIPALPAHLSDAGYAAYLAVVPADNLARIYDRWGPRLLEQNVRVFLQARGKVNKGIRQTLEQHPEMFFAYNNGITATAEAIKTRERKGTLEIVGMTNFQVVNGGQTTASIHEAFRRKIDLSNVFVQMKLSVISPEEATEVVPRISEFANSQNRVSAADFFANHPFHIRIEGFSRRIFAPSAVGAFRGSKWFYERARGQYQDARRTLTTSQRKAFDLEYPKNQVFKKEELAKYVGTWRGQPHLVSKGAQKNFAHFAGWVSKEWEKQADHFNEQYYRHAVAKAIVFRTTERLVSAQPWYQGGYRANVVTYSIAKMVADTTSIEKAIDLDVIWREQRISEVMTRALVVVSERVHEALVDTPTSVSNVTEWAKQEACWFRIKSMKVAWPAAWKTQLLEQDEEKSRRRDAVQDQRVLNGIEAQTLALEAGGTFWTQLLEWGRANEELTPTDVGVLETCAAIPRKLPTEKQCNHAMAVLARMQAAGCGLNIKDADNA